MCRLPANGTRSVPVTLPKRAGPPADGSARSVVRSGLGGRWRRRRGQLRNGRRRRPFGRGIYGRVPVSMPDVPDKPSLPTARGKMAPQGHMLHVSVNALASLHRLADRRAAHLLHGPADRHQRHGFTASHALTGLHTPGVASATLIHPRANTANAIAAPIQILVRFIEALLSKKGFLTLLPVYRQNNH